MELVKERARIEGFIDWVIDLLKRNPEHWGYDDKAGRLEHRLGRIRVLPRLRRVCVKLDSEDWIRSFILDPRSEDQEDRLLKAAKGVILEKADDETQRKWREIEKTLQAAEDLND